MSGPRCAQCGGPYTASKSGQRYCTPRCRKSAKRKRIVMRERQERGPGRPPQADGEETYRTYPRFSATELDALGDFALQRGLIRKTRGEDTVSPDIGAAIRLAVRERLKL
jgi:hypothetical protein